MLNGEPQAHRDHATSRYLVETHEGGVSEALKWFAVSLRKITHPFFIFGSTGGRGAVDRVFLGISI